ncbi:hypothetical protein GON03_19225 [Nocardioides sp. MAH-18]|uniref:Uncharacterized protein n=1 Tax=Nocardioides agri TaxID=2682843 RepID=A0A6L6XX92_9ACTN|nr:MULTISPECIES: hypothetical protein [unclassified Nocardioides]MBA2952151.1 hypothetical protein [Nocardioides sp. CGMCC 1.13656]MVQ51317.1 hypothetical protein [Nocardioides sp. MAH-18]
MPILDLQKRARTLGRIRLGQKAANGAPQKLDRFRFTSHSQALLEKIAELYGGEVREWTPAGGTQQWEVISGSARVPIMVPPQPVSQWYEFWTRAGCQHRCDGRTNVLTDEPCDPEDPKHLEAIKKPTTRLNVVLRDVEGIGVWRVESHGFNAAIELPDVAEFLAAAGGYVNGWLALEQRTSVEQTDQGPKTRHYAVPIIEVDVTPAQLMEGKGRVAAPALTGGPVGETPALAAAGPDYVAIAADLTDPEDVRNLWRQANAAGHMTQGLSEHLQQRVSDLTTAEPPARSEPQPDADGAYEAEVVEDQPAPAGTDDPDAIWQQIVATAGHAGMTTSQLRDDFPARMGGLLPDEATAAELRAYLQVLTKEPAA